MSSLISFREFMHRALYDETSGYYTQGASHIGKEGDFFTSVSVGDLFGRLLCRRFLTLWEDMSCPSEFHIIEMGANNARLANDILDEALLLSASFAQAIRYTIIEPLPSLRKIQAEATGGRAKILASTPARSLGKGVFFANELLDAFPVRMAIIQEGKWMERMITDTCPYEWDTSPLPAGEAPPADPSLLPEGYITEWVDNYNEFFGNIAPLLDEGLFLFIDYGRTRADYYSPARKEGTLRTYYRHTRTDDPLIHVGEQDITADVDFTTVAEEAGKHDLFPGLYLEQAHWLTSIAREWLLNLEKSSLPPEKMRKDIAQFQTLTHPQHMGLSFKVLELFKGPKLLPPLLFPRTGVKELL